MLWKADISKRLERRESPGERWRDGQIATGTESPVPVPVVLVALLPTLWLPQQPPNCTSLWISFLTQGNLSWGNVTLTYITFWTYWIWGETRQSKYKCLEKQPERRHWAQVKGQTARPVTKRWWRNCKNTLALQGQRLWEKTGPLGNSSSGVGRWKGSGKVDRGAMDGKAEQLVLWKN